MEKAKKITPVTLFLLLWGIFQLVSLFVPMAAMNLRIGHSFFLLGAVFLCGKGHRALRWPGFVLAVGVLGTIYLLYPGFAAGGGRMESYHLVLGFVLLLVLLVAAGLNNRRMLILALIFIAYLLFGSHLPGVFGHAGFSPKRMVGYLVWSGEGIFGVGASVSATYLFTFLLLGVVLNRTGFAGVLSDLAMALAGKSMGGPAKVSVLASAFLGMVNGSAVANVATTGAVTIPLMKKNGCKPAFAAAVEAVASTGGQFTPPIMGAVGFVMAEYLGIPYRTVMLAAIVPATLYYLGLLCSVHFTAKKEGHRGLTENVPPALELLKTRGYQLLPLPVLVGMIFLGFTPIYAAVAAAVLSILLSAGKKETRLSAGDLLDLLIEGAKASVQVGLSCLLIGILIGTVTLSGLGLSLGYALLESGLSSHLFFAGLLSMAFCTLLGAGVPGVAAYVIVTPVAVPCLIGAGADPVSAHLFCLIYACLGNITPPVAMSSYVAAGIAGANETRTSLIAIKLGLIGFIVPFSFLFDSALLPGVGGTPLWAFLLAVAAILLGTVGLTAALSGMLAKPLGPAFRCAFAAASLPAFFSRPGLDVLSIVLLVLLYACHCKFSPVKEN